MKALLISTLIILSSATVSAQNNEDQPAVVPDHEIGTPTEPQGPQPAVPVVNPATDHFPPEDSGDGVKMSQLGFFLFPGRTTISLGVSGFSSESSVDVLFGQNFYESRSAGNFAAYQMSHGLTENIEIGLGMVVTGTQRIETLYGPSSTANGTTDSSKSTGSGNPILAFRSRILDSETSTMFASLQWSPSLIKAKSASGQSDGNLANAQASMDLELKLVKKLNTVELAGFLRRIQRMDGQSESAQTGVETQRSGFHSTEIGAEFRQHFQQTYLGAGLKFSAEEEGTTKSPTNSVIYKSTFDSLVSVVAGWELNSQWLLEIVAGLNPTTTQDWILTGTTLTAEKKARTQLTATLGFQF